MTNEFLKYYNSEKKKKKLKSYNFQVQFIDRLSQIYEKIFFSNTFFSKLKRKESESTYVYGLPGGGKTYIANLFVQFLKKKKLDHYVLRIHFQEFISMIHAQINKYRLAKSTNPLDDISKNLSKKYKLICFDELEIIDIADAMIVSNLFSSLLEKKISFIITSNFKPSELYKFGLQREQFLPFIDIIKKRMEVICLNNNIDLRKKMNNKKSFSFIYPLNNLSQKIFFSILKKVKKKTTYRSCKLKSLGRDLVFDKTIDDLLIVDFKFLCSYKFSPNDYITISNFFDWFFIDNIPELNDSKINEARRFIILIDILYEKKKKLVVRAEKKLEQIFTLKKNKDLPFLRTASRITEMTAKKWIKI